MYPLVLPKKYKNFIQNSTLRSFKKYNKTLQQQSIDKEARSKRKYFNMVSSGLSN